MIIICIILVSEFLISIFPNAILHDPCTLLSHHQAYAIDPGGPEAPAQQEHRPLRSETRERSAFLRLRFPTGHYFPHSLSTI